MPRVLTRLTLVTVPSTASAVRSKPMTTALLYAAAATALVAWPIRWGLIRALHHHPANKRRSRR